MPPFCTNLATTSSCCRLHPGLNLGCTQVYREYNVFNASSKKKSTTLKLAPLSRARSRKPRVSFFATMMEHAWMRMQEDEAASGVGCLLDGPSHQRPCTGAYPAIDDMGKTFDVWHHANADDGYNTSVSEADPGSWGTDADDMQSMLVSWHGAPLDMPDDHRSPPATPPIASGGEVLPSEESFLHTPPSPRTGSPEIPLECGSRGHTSDAGGHLGVLPMDSRPSGAASADRHVATTAVQASRDKTRCPPPPPASSSTRISRAYARTRSPRSRRRRKQRERVLRRERGV